ncbi:MAG: DNA-binding protein [Micavibrio sp.]|nr:DNA-binding protein [Micavibrio sp.]HCK32815.1 DNA-binding protein [Rhodospirillaceae bacterium]|tara:strand:- start:1096 stop:1299 length:204 start_codon:yes stop_codon:yes gene_type:complete
MQLLSEKEAAALLNCSVFKLQKDRRIGSDIPYIKIGRSVKYDRVALEEYLKARTFRSTSEYDGGCNG